jgi:hypothetical protein
MGLQVEGLQVQRFRHRPEPVEGLKLEKVYARAKKLRGLFLEGFRGKC